MNRCCGCDRELPFSASECSRCDGVPEQARKNILEIDRLARHTDFLCMLLAALVPAAIAFALFLAR